MRFERKHGWRPALYAYLLSAAAEPFVYGRHDCALHAAAAVQAMTGVDPAAPWRGRYTTFRGGVRVLRKEGHEDHIAAVSAWFDETPPLMARVGDLAQVPGDGGPALGVVQGESVSVLLPRGLGLVPLTAADRAWRVG